MDQRGLVERAAGGDQDAFSTLLDGSLARLDAAARLILRDRELARDAVQEAMVRAWRDLPRLREPERFDAWLHRLTVNACLDLARRRRRRVIEVELTPFDDRAVADSAALIADRDLLDHAMRRLDTDARAVVVLRFYLGLSLEEVAGAIGIELAGREVQAVPRSRGDAHVDRDRRRQHRSGRTGALRMILATDSST